jgi:hypothetical protein
VLFYNNDSNFANGDGDDSGDNDNNKYAITFCKKNVIINRNINYNKLNVT